MGCYRYGTAFQFLLFFLFKLVACNDRDLKSEVVGVWAFVGQNVPGARHSECAATIEHTKLGRYRGLIAGAEVSAVRWRDLLVDGATCSTSQGAQTATIFVNDSRPEARFFARAQDNSPRRCGAFDALRPARYYFTDDIGSVRDWLADNTILSTGNASVIFDNTPIDARWMMSQQFVPDTSGAVSSRVVCFYRKSIPTPTPSPQKRVCFPASATVITPNGNVRMKELRIGHSIAVHLAGTIQWANVYFFSHRDAYTKSEFVRIRVRVDSNTNTRKTENVNLTLTPSHYVLGTNGRLHTAGSLLINQRIASGTVRDVAVVRDAGLFAPHTTFGEPIVDGILVSQYTDAVHPAAAHAALAPLRALWRTTRLGFAIPTNVHLLLDIMANTRRRRRSSPHPPPPWFQLRIGSIL